jgi:hypothetical protein
MKFWLLNEKCLYYLHQVAVLFWFGEQNKDKRAKLNNRIGGDYEECRLLGYKIPVRTSQETLYVSATESSQLMLSKIWGFHGSDYEECRLLGYKIPDRTSQETHYIFVTEPSRLILCTIWGFHGGDYEESRLLGCYAVWLLLLVTANDVPSSPILVALMIEAIHPSETTVHTRAIRRNISEDGILQQI